MKKLPILLTLITSLLASCDFVYDPVSPDENPSDNPGEKETHEHVDLNLDHICDICNYKITNCSDLNPKDHHCDICQNVMSQHVDSNGDFLCDICNENMNKPVHNHVDGNNDHKCDECQTILSNCYDINPKDHKCDVCGKVLSQCNDVNPKDHKCDVCGKVLSQCNDVNPKDHKCDVCGKVLSQCNDVNPKDHKCDVCGKVLSECVDANKDNKCDICGKILSEGGGGQGKTGDYTSTWPSEYQPYVVSYLNGMLPCFLNANKKNLFTGFKTGCLDGESTPYFNPYIENTSPSINYEYDYGSILRDAGFKFLSKEKDEDGDDVHYYENGYCKVQYSKYQSEGTYYFDVYAYYDYYCETIFDNAWNIQADNKDLALKSKYESNNKTVKINKWDITLYNIMQNSNSIQLKSSTGKITIKGAIKALFVEFYPHNGGSTYNSDDFMVKAGTSSSNAKYIFNEGGLYTFPTGTTYVEMFATKQVVNIEFFDLIY